MSKKSCIGAAAVMLALLCGCGNSQTADETAAPASEISADPSERSAAAATSKEIDVSALFENYESSSEDAIIPENPETFATVTDVANELDRAIYKAQVDIPEGWNTNIDSAEGKFYSSPNGTLMIKAQNYGGDTELEPLEKLADSMAASITMSNMFSQADTKFSEPRDLTIDGRPAIGYDYAVTAYIFVPDENGGTNADGETEERKEVYGKYKDELYVLYDGTDAYVLLFEAPEDKYDTAKPQFDAIRESFRIAEDGKAGYEAASEFAASQASLQESILNSAVSDELSAE